MYVFKHVWKVISTNWIEMKVRQHAHTIVALDEQMSSALQKVREMQEERDSLTQQLTGEKSTYGQRMSSACDNNYPTVVFFSKSYVLKGIVVIYKVYNSTIRESLPPIGFTIHSLVVRLLAFGIFYHRKVAKNKNSTHFNDAGKESFPGERLPMCAYLIFPSLIV